MSSSRTASVTRATSESRVELSLDLDGTGASTIDTGVPFYDHMLTAFAKHSLTDLTVRAEGDVEIDAHHTVEDVAIATDAQDRIVFVNSGAIRVLGADLSALMGTVLGDILQPVDKPMVDGVEEFRIEQDDASERWIRGSWRIVRDPANRPFARLLVARDVTRDRQLRRDLVRSGALAELGMMAAEVAHEVNNPATYLMTNLSLLRDDINADALDKDQAIDMIEECLDGVTRIADIVRRMRGLATAHAEEDTGELVDLGMVVRDVCRMAGLRVKYKAELHIFDAEGVSVHGSAKRLAQVVLNLVVNAADALTGQIDPLPRIDVTVKTDDGRACVDVRDNGPGVPDELASRMFEAFVTSKAGEGGTGLGLAVSQTIADEHGGSLELMSHGDRGAWFRLGLPLPDASETTAG
jgi:signal transduction histidine kinase